MLYTYTHTHTKWALKARWWECWSEISIFSTDTIPTPNTTIPKKADTAILISNKVHLMAKTFS